MLTVSKLLSEIPWHKMIEMYFTSVLLAFNPLFLFCWQWHSLRNLVLYVFEPFPYVVNDKVHNFSVQRFSTKCQMANKNAWIENDWMFHIFWFVVQRRVIDEGVGWMVKVCFEILENLKRENRENTCKMLSDKRLSYEFWLLFYKSMQKRMHLMPI